MAKKENEQPPQIPRANSPNVITEIRIRRVKTDTVGALRNIAAHLGIDVSRLLKPELRKIVESYPEHMRLPLKDY